MTHKDIAVDKSIRKFMSARKVDKYFNGSVSEGTKFGNIKQLTQ